MSSAQVSSRTSFAVRSGAHQPELVLYAAPHSSASPVQSALLELGVAHQTVKLDLAAQEQRTPKFLALNPNGKVPTLLVDGEPMFEALAILIYLGERFGVESNMWPAADTAERRCAHAWATWAYVTYGQQLVLLQHATSEQLPSEVHNPAQAKLALERINGMLDLVEARLAAQPFMLGASYSLLDLIVASVLGYGTWLGARVDGHPHVHRWLAQFQARPAYAAGMSLAA
ncbi:MAG TPA: glutathione S-transferase family protein [Polyangiaceae bacterium]|nr:glutathione S-transferase family protein [Polyangiaceae bacterium]